MFVCVAACVLQIDQKRPGGMPLVFPYVNNPAQPVKLTPLVEATRDQSKLPLVAPDQRAKLAQKSRRIKSNYTSGQEYEQQRQQREREQWEQQREQREQPVSYTHLTLPTRFAV